MTSTSLVDFCDQQNINWFPISLTITDDKKKLLNPINHSLYNFQRPKNTDFKNIEKQIIQQRQQLIYDNNIKKDLNLNAMWIDTSEVYHIDIDTPDYHAGFDSIAETTPYFKSMTKPYGKHILIKTSDFKAPSNRIQFKNEGVELLCGQASYAPFEIFNADKEIQNFLKIKEMLVIKNSDIPTGQATEEVINRCDEIKNLTEIEQLLECIGNSRCSTGKFKEWYEVGQAIKNELKDEGNKYFINWTNKYGSDNKKSEAYDQITKYIKYTPKKDKKRLSIASLHHWAKESDEELYNNLFNDIIEFSDEEKETLKLIKNVMENPNETNFAKLYIEVTNNNIKCIDMKNKILYICENGLWNQNIGGASIRNSVFNIFEDLFKKAFDIYQSKKTDKTEKICYKITEIRFKLGMTSIKNNILTEIMSLTYDDTFVDKLNRKIDYLPVKNGLLNINTFEIEERKNEDYFTYEANAQFIPYCEGNENFKFVDKYFDDLFCGNQETKKCVIDILKSCLTGRTLRYIYFLTGVGSNGKSLLLKILSLIFNDAVDTISKLVVIKQKGNHNGVINTELEKLDKCRLGLVSELQNSDELNITIIKQITGGDNIDFRGLFKTNKTIIPTCNMFCATNQLPSFEVQKAILNRLIVIPFNNVFEINPNFEDELMSKKDYILSYILCKGELKFNFDLSEEMLMTMKDYQNENVDKLKEFTISKLENCVNDKINKPIKIEEFRELYNIWCKKLSYPLDRRTKTAFTKALKSFDYECKESHSIMKIYNVKWINEDEDEDENED